MKKFLLIVFMAMIVLVGCMPKAVIRSNDSLFFSEKEKQVYKNNKECNPLLGAVVNKSRDDVNVLIFYEKEGNSYEFIEKLELKSSLENNAVCEEGDPIYIKYFLLPDYGVYVLKIVIIFKEIEDGKELIFTNVKYQKFEITKDNKCNEELKIGWYLEII